MQVTFLRGSGASERELEALAIYMGETGLCRLSASNQRIANKHVCFQLTKMVTGRCLLQPAADMCFCGAGHSVEMQRSTYDR